MDPVAKKDNGDRDLRAMASCLQVVANERRRLKEGAAALQQKLDALTGLEKSLSDRPTPNR